MRAMHRPGRWRAHNADVRVLVVEDDDAVSAALCDGLRRAGFEASRVGTGTDAVANVSAAAPDFVLLDLGLPDMDGTDVCRAIRALSQVPIIVVSARSEEIDRVLALEMGADAEDLSLTIHAHPTLSETIFFAAEIADGTITDLLPAKR